MYNADWTSAAVLVSTARVCGNGWSVTLELLVVTGSCQCFAVPCTRCSLQREVSTFLVEHVDVSLDYSIKEKHTQSW